MEKIKTNVCAAVVFLMVLLAAGCDMMDGPEAWHKAGNTGNTGKDGKAAVSLSIEGAADRTIAPQVKLTDVQAWRLLGAKTGGGQVPLTEKVFADPAGQTLYLDAGNWDFTLKGYRDEEGKDLILEGDIEDQEITLEGTNTLQFTVAPLEEGTGTVKITIELPEGHGINRVAVFKDNDPERNSPRPEGNSIVFEDTLNAGDYYYSFRLYSHKDAASLEGDLYGVVSELVSVRANLASEKIYTLGEKDLNIRYDIDYQSDGGGFAEPKPSYYYYQYTDANFTLPIPDWSGYEFKGWYDNEALSGDPVTQITQSSTGDKTFWAKWLGTAKAITAFTVAGQTGDSIIDDDSETVTVTVPWDTALTNLTPTITISDKATVSPESGVAQDFTDPVKYTVTAEDGTEADWIVTVKAVLASVDVIASYLDTASAPVTLPVKINLASDWAALLTAISSKGKTVDLDLSACDMSGTVFDPGTGTVGVDKIVSLILPDTAESIAAGMSDPTFKNFTSLKSVAGSKVETIGDGAFDGTNSLETVSLPKAKEIGNYAFRSCTGLTEVSLPKATTINARAFYGCSSLAAASLPAAETIGLYAFSGCTGLTEVNLPAAKTFGWSAFSGCFNLTEVSLPVAEIFDSYVFSGCTGLTEVSLPAAKTFGNSAFENTEAGALAITLGQAAPKVGTNLFNGISGTKPVIVKVPSTATDWNGKTGTFTTDTTTENWGNAFRGMGWNGLTYQSGTVNGNISLTITYQ